MTRELLLEHRLGGGVGHVGHGVAGGGVHGVARVEGGADGLGGSSNGVVGDVGSTEVVHVGCVSPVGVDGGIVVEHALVSSTVHAVGSVVDRVLQEALGNVGRGDVGSSEEDAVGVIAGADSAGVGANAGSGEGLEVDDVVEHFLHNDQLSSLGGM